MERSSWSHEMVAIVDICSKRCLPMAALTKWVPALDTVKLNKRHQDVLNFEDRQVLYSNEHV